MCLRRRNSKTNFTDASHRIRQESGGTRQNRFFFHEHRTRRQRTSVCTVAKAQLTPPAVELTAVPPLLSQGNRAAARQFETALAAAAAARQQQTAGAAELWRKELRFSLAISSFRADHSSRHVLLLLLLLLLRSIDRACHRDGELLPTRFGRSTHRPRRPHNAAPLPPPLLLS